MVFRLELNGAINIAYLRKNKIKKCTENKDFEPAEERQFFAAAFFQNSPEQKGQQRII
jgi:hypothetical protein